MVILRNTLEKYKERLKENSCVTLIWLINILPTLARFPLLNKSIGASYWMSWVVNICLLFYINVVGTIAYQMYYATRSFEIVISTFNLSIALIVGNNCFWFIFNRDKLNNLLRLTQRNDKMIKDSGRNLNSQRKFLRNIKYAILAYYVWQIINICIGYIPFRVVLMDEFAIVNCVGIEPLTVFPKRQICMGIIAIQSYMAILVAVCFDVMFLYLVSHTTAVFQVLHEDLTDFTDVAQEFDGSMEMNSTIVDRINNVIVRHFSALETLSNIQDIYGTAVGITFATEAVSLCLFFILSIEEGLDFLTLILHSFFMFYVYCYLGERLTAASERFEMAVYSCGWEYLGVEEQKNVLLILMQAQKPVMISAAKDAISNTRRQLQDVSFESLLWLVNVVPNFAGFAIQRDKIKVPFWILHLSLLSYVYGVGTLVYQCKFAQGAGDFIKSYVNVSLFILIANNSWWFLAKRPFLKAMIKKIELNDQLARVSDSSKVKHRKLLIIIKRIVIMFYAFNCFDAFFIYLPHRADVSNDYSMTPCVGMEPLMSSPNREICLTILCVQELTIMTVALNFQALLLFLIAHTAAMYQILSDELMALNDFEDLDEHKAFVKSALPSLVRRHVLTLDVVNKLKSLYSMPIGVNFGTNAVCILLFFYLPLQEWLKFIPILVYCFLVFFLYCFLCQKLVNASEMFESAVYCCGWENFGLNEKKMICVMLCQAQKPIELLAADIIPVNIYTFATTLQAMFKFVTVVKF